MRLTNTIRDAYIRAVMQNVPSVDYQSQASKLVLDDIMAQLPPKVREIAMDKDQRRHLRFNYITTPGFKSSTGVLGSDDLRVTQACATKVRELAALNDQQDGVRNKLKTRLRQVAYSVSTSKALAEMLPEFARYLPADAPAAARSLPTVVNVVQDFVAAGWKAPS